MEITTLILTSAVVSGVVTFVLKFFFENRQQRKFDIEIEKLKHHFAEEQEKLRSKLELKEAVIATINEEKLSLYPKFCEFVYRTRNLSRELISGSNSDDIKNELASKSSEIENLLYKHRIYLENDRIFYLVHSYKNLQSSFMKTVQRSDARSDHNTLADLNELYSEIDRSHKEIVDKFNEKLNQLKE